MTKVKEQKLMLASHWSVRLSISPYSIFNCSGLLWPASCWVCAFPFPCLLVSIDLSIWPAKLASLYSFTTSPAVKHRYLAVRCQRAERSARSSSTVLASRAGREVAVRCQQVSSALQSASSSTVPASGAGREVAVRCQRVRSAWQRAERE